MRPQVRKASSEEGSMVHGSWFCFMFRFQGLEVRNRPPQDTTVGLCLEPYGGPGGGGAFL